MRLTILVGLLVTTAIARGDHVRLETDRGPVHVWRPADYDPATAGVVVYVHGYFTDVDRAWARHRLGQQFAESGINAVFVACEAPASPRDDVRWPALGALLDEVAAGLGEPLPDGRIVAVGHSGAHRTLSAWLDRDDIRDDIDTIVLVDAMYGEIPRLRAWLDAADDHRLIDAAALTRRWSDAFHAELGDTLVFERFPPPRAGKLAGARRARVVYVRSQHDHMGLVTDGIALPMLLRALELPVVASTSRQAPIHVP